MSSVLSPRISDGWQWHVHGWQYICSLLWLYSCASCVLEIPCDISAPFRDDIGVVLLVAGIRGGFRYSLGQVQHSYGLRRVRVVTQIPEKQRMGYRCLTAQLPLMLYGASPLLHQVVFSRVGFCPFQRRVPCE